MTFRPRRSLIAMLALAAVATGVYTAVAIGATPKAPIKIMVLSSWDNPIIDLGDIPIIIKDLASARNATKGSGGRGINGHQVIVISCNDKGDPNAAEACARKAVSENVVAVVGGFSLFGNRIFPVLEAAGIPWVGNFAYQAIDHTSAMSFPTSPGLLNTLAISALAARGCKNLVLMGSTATWSNVESWLVDGVKSQSRPIVATIVVPAKATDYAPYAAQVKAKNADCIASTLTESMHFQLVPALTAVGLQKIRVYATAGTTLTERLAAQYTKETEGWVGIAYYPTLDNPVWASYRKALDKYNNLGKYTPNAGGSSELRSVIGFTILEKVAAKITGDVTAAKFVKALNKTCKVDTGGQAPAMNFCKENPVPTLKRIFDTSVMFQVLRNGKFKMLNPKYQDMLPNYLRVHP